MKRYPLAVHTAFDAPRPPPDEMQVRYDRVDRVNDELRASGAWVFGGGLLPPDMATVVRAADGRTTMTDGPFAETKEALGGFRCATTNCG